MSHSSSFIRTDKAIMQAFIDILKEKPFEKITVQDILDKTPVTRATFYAHYHDKYEIAERMLQQFFQLRDDIREKLANLPASKMNHIVKKSITVNYELIEALLKIHTEKVDLRQAFVNEYEKFYLDSANLSSHEDVFTQAHIYAQARTELDFSFVHNKEAVYSFETSNELMLAVCLKLLRLDDDEDVWHFLRKKLAQKFPAN